MAQLTFPNFSLEFDDNSSSNVIAVLMKQG